MKTFTKKSQVSFYKITFFSLLLLCSIWVKANEYDDGKIIIDSFTTGQLGESITNLHSNLSEITTLQINQGTLNPVDISWMNNNLANLTSLQVIYDCTLTDGLLPDNSFRNHKNLKSCKIQNATTIGKNAFNGCANLTIVGIYETESIGDSAFAKCNSFWKLEPNLTQAPSIGKGTFEGCNPYRQIRFSSEGISQYKSVDDGDTTDNFWYGFELLIANENTVEVKSEFTTGEISEAIIECRSDLSVVTQLHITEGILNNTDVYWIRDNLPNLEFLAINGNATFLNGSFPDDALKNHQTIKFANISTATTIGNSSFEGCYSLSVAAVSSANSLGDNAFKGCSSCIQLYINPFTPPTIESGTFDGCTASNRVIDLYYTTGSNCDPDAYMAVQDGNTEDNYWYGWEIKPCGSTIIIANTDNGGNIDWGQPSSWDNTFENCNGAVFWNGEDWRINETYGHMYFCDTRFSGIRQGNYSGINYQIPKGSTTDEGRMIWGYRIIAEENEYSVDAVNGGKFTYAAVKYTIIQPDGTAISCISKGNGNGTESAYLEIVIEDLSPGIITIREGGVISDVSNYTFEEAAELSLFDSLVVGRFVTTSLLDKKNYYYFDINGGDEMGGMSYIMETCFLPTPKTIETYDLAQTYISEFSVNFKNDAGELESFIMVPLLKSESYIPSNTSANEDIKRNSNELIIYPNPAAGILYFEVSINTRPFDLKIIDVHGRVVCSKKSFSQKSIDVSELQAGVYFLSLQSENEMYNARFVKK